MVYSKIKSVLEYLGVGSRRWHGLGFQLLGYKYA